MIGRLPSRCAFVLCAWLSVVGAVHAQGSLVIYVILIWVYALYMNRLDHEYGVNEGEDD